MPSIKLGLFYTYVAQRQRSSPRGDSEVIATNRSKYAAQEGRQPLLIRGLGMILGSAVRVRSPRPDNTLRIF